MRSVENIVLILIQSILVVLVVGSSGSSSSSIVEEQLRFIQNPYIVTQIESLHPIVDATIEYTGDREYYLKESSPIVKTLRLMVIPLSSSEVSVKITDNNNRRWELPEEEPFPNDRGRQAYIGQTDYQIELQEQPFALRIIREGNGEILFDTSNSVFTYSDKYIEIQTIVPSRRVFGLGERNYQLLLENGIYTINPIGLAKLENATGNGNEYGHHPMYLFQEAQSQIYSIILFRSANPMDVTLEQFEDFDDYKTINFKVVGGIIHFRCFFGVDQYPDNIIKRYHDYLGKWNLPPFWSFGWHQSRWGYTSLSKFKELSQKFDQYQIPIDTIWSDLDYMVHYIDFEIDEIEFNPVEFREFLEESKLNWVPIVDAGIDVSNTTGYLEGVKQNVFIRSSIYDDYLIGTVWPKQAHFVDWFHPNATIYWKQMLGQMKEKIPFSGLWIDMNEPTLFCDGECPNGGLNGTEKPPSEDPYEADVPYRPGNVKLDFMTLAPYARHYGNITNLNVRSTFGHMMTKATYDYLLDAGYPQPFVLTRGNFFGTGKYGNHWTGDNWANWTWMRLTIPNIMSMNLFGIPFVGGDICGFEYNTTEELCGRWTQLGVLYPFTRNHNTFNGIPQEPYALDKLTLQTNINSIRLKYSLLKYYYSLFVMNRGTGTIFKPLCFVFPQDDETYKEKTMNEQFMIGNDLMAVPILYEGQVQAQAYFPGCDWYSYSNGTKVNSRRNGGGYKIIYNYLPDIIPLYIREGGLIMKQDTINVTRSFHLKNKFSIVAAVKNERSRMRATGKILGLTDYTLTKDHLEMCSSNDCLITIDLYINPRKQDIILVQFKKSSNVTTLPNPFFTIDKIQVYGFAPPHNSVPQAYSVRKNLGRMQIQIKHHYLMHNLDSEQVYIEFSEPAQINNDEILEIKFIPTQDFF